MARTTISIPDDLQKRMRRMKSANWSSIAAEAFERKLKEMKRMTLEEVMTATDRGEDVPYATLMACMTPAGKPLGECTREDLEKLKQWCEDRANKAAEKVSQFDALLEASLRATQGTKGTR